MNKTKELLIQSADNLRAGLAIEKSLKYAKFNIIKLVFEEFKNQMGPYCEKYGLEFERVADYYTYDDELQERFYSSNACPGLNYVVKKAKFKDENLQMWFRIEVESNLFAGFCIYDFNAKSQGNRIGYEVLEIDKSMFKEATNFLDESISEKGMGWWLAWAYPNGKIIESNSYEDVPNFKFMNECAINMADKEYREKYVENALKTFETMLLCKLK